MKRWAILFGIILLFPIGTALAQNDPIEEDVELDSSEFETIVYKVGLDLISVGKIDRESGSSDLIFWWTIVSDDVDFTEFPPPGDSNSGNFCNRLYSSPKCFSYTINPDTFGTVNFQLWGKISLHNRSK